MGLPLAATTPSYIISSAFELYSKQFDSFALSPHKRYDTKSSYHFTFVCVIHANLGHCWSFFQLDTKLDTLVLDLFVATRVVNCLW